MGRLVIGRACVVFVAKLAAGGGDVSASAGADVAVDPGGLQDVLEVAHACVGGAGEGEGGDLVVADQVDVAAQVFCDVCEFVGVFGLVVDAA